MTNEEKKYISAAHPAAANQGKYNFDVMKPFLKFGFAAMGIIGGALIAIVKSIPKPSDDNDSKAVIKR